MKRKTPYSTGMGSSARHGVISTDTPVRMAMHRLVTRCSRMPRNCAFSPGIFVLLSYNINKNIKFILAKLIKICKTQRKREARFKEAKRST